MGVIKFCRISVMKFRGMEVDLNNDEGLCVGNQKLVGRG